MKTQSVVVNTVTKKFPFAFAHPSGWGTRLTRTLIVSEILYVPDGYASPSHAELGWLNPNSANVTDIIRHELIRSKVDGLSPAMAAEVTHTVNKGTIYLLQDTIERQQARNFRRYAIKVTMPADPAKVFWFEMNVPYPLRTHAQSEWSGINDPSFYERCVWVSDVVAAGKAVEIMDRWQQMGFPDQPVSAEVREICYGWQRIQLATEVQRDALHGSVCAFTSPQGNEVA